MSTSVFLPNVALKYYGLILYSMRSIRIYLDTELRDRQASTAARYVWNVHFGSNQAADGVHLLNSGDIQNICGIKTQDMLIYNNGNVFVNTPNIALQVAEFATDAVQNGPMRYHFSMYTNISMLCRVKNKGEYWFNKIFSQMPNTISLTFFNEWSQMSFPTNAPIYTDINQESIVCHAQAARLNDQLVLTGITSDTPGTLGTPNVSYGIWGTPFYKTTSLINSVLNTAAEIYVTLTTDNPADAAQIVQIAQTAWPVTSVTHDAEGNATVTIAADLSGILGQITGATFTATCPYVWFTVDTTYNSLIANKTQVYIRSFISHIPSLDVSVFNALVNRQDGWQYRPVGNLAIYILLGLNPLGTQDVITLSAVGQFEALRLIVPLEIFYLTGV